jgi:hypothetical protein
LGKIDCAGDYVSVVREDQARGGALSERLAVDLVEPADCANLHDAIGNRLGRGVERLLFKLRELFGTGHADARQQQNYRAERQKRGER